MSELESILAEEAAAVMDMYVQRLIEAGDEALEMALSSEAYHNISGNLRSSIGYGVYLDGEEMHVAGFIPFQGSEGDGRKGVATGLATLRRAASENTEGLALIMVCGMDYVTEVEAEGKPVITDATLLADALVKQMMR